MRLALFDDYRLGVVAGEQIVDVTGALPAHDAGPVSAGWWRALCRDFAGLRPGLEAAAAAGTPVPLAAVRLRAPALNAARRPDLHRRAAGSGPDLPRRRAGHPDQPDRLDDDRSALMAAAG